MKNFISLNELIHRLDFLHSELANYIEMNGVYSCTVNNEISFYDSDSPEIERALLALYNDLHDKLHSEKFGPEWEQLAEADLYRYQGQDPIYFFGWPEDKAPDPWDVDEEPNWIGSKFYSISSGIYISDPRIYTIGRLLVTRKATPAEIATEIERSGIYGFDRVDRLELFTYDLSFQSALDVLADWTRFTKNDPSLKSSVHDDVRLRSFGWPRGKLPSFPGLPKGYGLTEAENSAVPKDPDMPEAAAAVTREVILSEIGRINYNKEQSYQAIIGGLLSYIVGGQGSDPHQNFKSERHLRLWIERTIGIRGAGRGTSKKFFKAAKALLAENNINLPADDSEDQPEDDTEVE